MSSIPILFPSRADCRVADADYVHVPNVVFSCGMLRRDDGSLVIYYAGNDTVMNALSPTRMSSPSYAGCSARIHTPVGSVTSRGPTRASFTADHEQEL